VLNPEPNLPMMPNQPEQLPPRNNARTALVLLSVAFVFFLGVIGKRVLFG
jgi:hypothetical protein